MSEQVETQVADSPTNRRPAMRLDGATAELDAGGIYYRQLNEQVRDAIAAGATRIVLRSICGQRYIGTGLRKDVAIEIEGTPGNDLAMFMDGPSITVRGNGQDGVGNTMTSGQIVVHGCAGDLLAHSLRGGRIFVRDGAGYRVAIHMKQYQEPVPSVVIGGCVGDYAGEYMAGGVLVVLGLDRGLAPDSFPVPVPAVGSPQTANRNPQSNSGDRHALANDAKASQSPRPLAGNYLGTGMHGGAIYLRGDVQDHQMGREISRVPMDDSDRRRLEDLVGQYAAHFGADAKAILAAPFVKLAATSSRPYGRLYVY